MCARFVVRNWDEIKMYWLKCGKKILEQVE